MKVLCLQENLRQAVATVGHAVPAKSTLPVLSNLLLTTDRGRLKLAATNLEIACTCWIGASVAEEGSITIPARLFSDVINGLPNDKVELTVDQKTETLTLTCAQSTMNIRGIDAEDFPVIPTVGEQAVRMLVPPDVLREAIEQVVFAVAAEETRPYLTGIDVHLINDTATFTATDGYRVARKTIGLPRALEFEQQVIVPARALLELARNLRDVDSDVEVIITASGGQILFHSDKFDLVSRLVDGKYPDLSRVFPTTFVTRAVIDTQQLARAVKLTSYFASTAANMMTIQFIPGEASPGRLTLTTAAAEVGNNQSVVEGLVQGEAMQLAINAKYVIEGLNSIATPQVVIEVQTNRTPAVFKPQGSDEQIYIVMPMNLAQ